jgi:glycosyltransferase involved in cell wall biosynthesis
MYSPHPEFVDDVNNMCRSFVDRLFEVEDFVGPFDVVHAHDWLAANAMIWIKQGRRHKTVFTIHSTEYARCGNAFTNGRSVRVREQERAGTYWADRIIAVSQATKDELTWMYEVPEPKISVIHNGVNPNRFDLQTDAGQDKSRYQIGPLDPTVLFCGRLVWQKGPDLLIEAIPQALRALSHAKFVFVGDGEMRGALEARARQLNVMHAVRFVGHRKGEDLIRLFKLADIVCVPSRNEPFGIVVLEAWSAGKPVVVTHNGGPAEYVRHEVNGLKIYPRPDSIAWGLTTLFADFERARRMGLNGRMALVQRFGWDTIATQTEQVYSKVCPVPFTPLPQAESEPSEVVWPTGAARARMVTDRWRSRNGSIELEARLLFPRSTYHDKGVIQRNTFKKVLIEQGLDVEEREGSLEVRGHVETVLSALVRSQRIACPPKVRIVTGVRKKKSDVLAEMVES